MSISRRKFLHTGTLAVVSVGIPLKVLAAGSDPARPASIWSAKDKKDKTASLDRDAFARCLNTPFVLRHRSYPPAKVTLTEIKDWQNHKQTKTKTECFSAIFLGSKNTRLPQATYSVEHDKLGKFELLIVPAHGSKQGVYYEALFNRLV